MDNDSSGLLKLIGNSIENLTECIELFNSADRDGGVQRLMSVLKQIETYLEEIDSDPIIKLASVSTGEVVGRLQAIETDLSAIVSDLEPDNKVPST